MQSRVARRAWQHQSALSCYSTLPQPSRCGAAVAFLRWGSARGCISSAESPHYLNLYTPAGASCVSTCWPSARGTACSSLRRRSPTLQWRRGRGRAWSASAAPLFTAGVEQSVAWSGKGDAGLLPGCCQRGGRLAGQLGPCQALHGQHGSCQHGLLPPNPNTPEDVHVPAVGSKQLKKLWPHPSCDLPRLQDGEPGSGRHCGQVPAI